MCFIAINIFAAALFRFDSPIFHIRNNKNENSSEKLEALRKKKGGSNVNKQSENENVCIQFLFERMPASWSYARFKFSRAVIVQLKSI